MITKKDIELAGLNSEYIETLGEAIAQEGRKTQWTLLIS